MADGNQLRRSDTRTVRLGESRDPLAADGFNMNDLGASEEAPPAYGEHMDQLHLTQSGFQAEAAVAGQSGTRSADDVDGRALT